MSYCQKCLDAIGKAIDQAKKTAEPESGSLRIDLRPIVSESECEFWAHQAYNRVRNILKAGIEDMGKEIPP